MLEQFSYSIIYDSDGKVSSVVKLSDNTKLSYDSTSQSFDESDPHVVQFRQWEQLRGSLDLSPITFGITPPLNLYTLKEEKTKAVIALALEKQQELVAGTSEIEISTWAAKEKEATAYLNSMNLSDAPSLKVEAKNKQESFETLEAATLRLAKEVIAKAEAFRAAMGKIIGTRSRYKKLVRATSTIDSLNNLDITSGWD